MRKSGSTAVRKSTVQTCLSTRREHGTIDSSIDVLVATFAGALLWSSVYQQVGGIFGVVTPSSIAISTELFATAGASCSEGVDVSTAI